MASDASTPEFDDREEPVPFEEEADWEDLAPPIRAGKQHKARYGHQVSNRSLKTVQADLARRNQHGSRPK